jgi:integrase
MVHFFFTSLNFDQRAFWAREIAARPAADIFLRPARKPLPSSPPSLRSLFFTYLFACESDSARPVPKVNNAHDRAVKASGIAPARLYDLRHTWATRAAMSGIDLVTLAVMLGHSRIQMVLRYAHPTQEHQAKAMEKLEAFNAVQQIGEFERQTARTQ